MTWLVMFLVWAFLCSCIALVCWVWAEIERWQDRRADRRYYAELRAFEAARNVTGGRR